jgi:hypothetical protein
MLGLKNFGWDKTSEIRPLYVPQPKKVRSRWFQLMECVGHVPLALEQSNVKVGNVNNDSTNGE